MKNTKTPRAIEQQWERAIEQAAENTSSTPELRTEHLKNAAGLHLKSGVQSGLWGVSNGCSQGCSAICEGH